MIYVIHYDGSMWHGSTQARNKYKRNKTVRAYLDETTAKQIITTESRMMARDAVRREENYLSLSSEQRRTLEESHEIAIKQKFEIVPYTNLEENL